MIETDSYDPIIIRMKYIKSDLFIFNQFQYAILGARIPIDYPTDYFCCNRLFSARYPHNTTVFRLTVHCQSAVPS